MMPWVNPMGYASASIMPVVQDAPDGKRAPLQTVHAHRYGWKMLPENVPRHFQVQTGRQTLPDLFLVDGGFLVASIHARRVLRDYNLGTSQFFEIDLLNRKGAPFGGSDSGIYAILNVTELKDTLVPEASDVEPFDHKDLGSVYKLPATSILENMTLTPAATEGVDLWREEREWRAGLYLSDRLEKALRAAKIRYPKSYRCRLTGD